MDLILANHGIGDLIMAFPMFEYLKKQGRRYDILVRSKPEEELLRQYNYGRLFYYKIGNIERIKFILSLPFNRYKSIIPIYGINKRLAKIISWISVGGKYIQPYYNYGEHKVKCNFRTVSETEVDSIEYPIWPYLHEKGKDNTKMAVAFCPGASSQEHHKCYQFKRWLNVFNNLRCPLEIELNLFGSKEEIEENKIFEKIDNKGIQIINRTGKTTISDLLRFMSRMDLAIGSDNGLLHVASLFKIPIVALFGPTNPEITAPWGDNVTILRNGKCSPCYWKGLKYGCGNPICMDFTEDVIIGSIESSLIKLSAEKDRR